MATGGVDITKSGGAYGSRLLKEGLSTTSLETEFEKLRKEVGSREPVVIAMTEMIDKFDQQRQLSLSVIGGERTWHASTTR
jgi:hypothetical protein